MTRATGYHIAEENTSNELSNTVNDMMDDGQWQPVGGPFVHTVNARFIFAQALAFFPKAKKRKAKR